MKIILAALEKHLFPERFPFFEKPFLDEAEFLKHNEGNCDIAFQNIAFKLKVVKLSLNIKNEQLRQALSYLFEKQVDCNYDWQQGYNWYELKSILCFFYIIYSPENIKGF